MSLAFWSKAGATTRSLKTGMLYILNLLDMNIRSGMKQFMEAAAV